METEDVQKLVQEIKDCTGDYEAQHVLEDRLYERVLRAIMKGKCYNPKDLAKEALKTKKIIFTRHCA